MAAASALARAGCFSVFGNFWGKTVGNLLKNGTFVLFLEIENPRKENMNKVFLNYFQISIDFLSKMWYNIVKKKSQDLGKDLGLISIESRSFDL